MDVFLDHLGASQRAPEKTDGPFIIWTLQRTGSTNLLRMLMYLSSYRTAEAEGFDPKSPERQFSWISELTAEERDYEIHRVCAGGWNLKHVVDRLPVEFNVALARATTRAGYRHVVLDRRDGAARAASLGVAEALGTWDPGAKTERVLRDLAEGNIGVSIDAPALARRQFEAEVHLDVVVGLLSSLYAPVYRAWFEDLYAGTLLDRVMEFDRIAKHVGITHWIKDERRIQHLLLKGGQDTSSALSKVEGAEELRARLATGERPPEPLP